ncbi:RNA polymerase, sigma 54 subunit, RpoN/SigL [Rhizobiales bacterium GAS188]|nr:RNA polymerase, sigma 54 subunit, RpoN/SigL [Rhizobiales bacterium GAS188]
MALSHRLEMRQGQSLVMTPQLLQAIKLLQLSSLDLAAYVEAELERNPLLERAEGDSDQSAAVSDGEGPGERSGDASDAAGGETDWAASEGAGATPDDASASALDGSGLDLPAGEWSAESAPPDRADIEERFGSDLGDVFPDEAAMQQPAPAASRVETLGLSSGPSTSSSSGTHDGEDHNLEAYVAAPISLHDHLATQLGFATDVPAERLIGREIIDGIDDAGYLTLDLAELAERLGVAVARVEQVLTLVQRFEPSGVGARSLAECLSLQLAERNRLDPVMRILVSRLDLVAKRDVAGLSRLCGVDVEDVLDMIAEIRALNPKPGLAFGAGVVQTVVPDVQVRASPDGSWNVELNPAALPRVLVNQDYHAKVTAGPLRDGDKAYIAECLQNANWLTRSLEQRARTVLKVASEIVRQQDAFLTQGVEHLRPLNLKTIADAISMHESTVSRVTSNKYIATPRGMFEMKYFFSSAIQSADGGEALSAQAVRFKIKQLIETEDPAVVLSDDTIVQRLRDGGVDIARRTVAKYRESMGIASSLERRRMKATHSFAVSA